MALQSSRVGLCRPSCSYQLTTRPLVPSSWSNARCKVSLAAAASTPTAPAGGRCQEHRRLQQHTWRLQCIEYLAYNHGTEEVTPDDRRHMRAALELARLGLGKTHPNPAVGCVIVKNGKVVGEGYHPKAGMPHAEVYALRGAGQAAQGATAYVTLEPCNHYGRTPPCSRALVEAGVSRVVVGVGDPNPLVASSGLATLRSAGIAVAVMDGPERQACYDLNPEFMARMEAEAAAV